MTTLNAGPCMFCGAVNYEPSVGGPGICPSCDCGNFGPEVVKTLGNQIVALRQKVEQAQRLIRVDAALAQQLRESIERNAKMHEGIARVRLDIEQWRKAYPVECFPEPDFVKAAELLEAGGMTLDTITASNLRHVLQRVAEIMKQF